MTIRSLEEEAIAAIEWSQQTFPNQTSQSLLTHLQEEIDELLDAPSDALEMADIFILLATHAYLHGVDLATAVRRKMEINRARRQATSPNEKGIYKHVEAPCST